MKLKEIIAEIIEKKFSDLPETQRPRALAKDLDVGEMDARRLIVAGRNQEKLFAVIMKLLPLCDELGIDPARELINYPASQQSKEMQNVTRIIKRIGVGALSKDATARSTDKIAQRGKKHISSSGTPGNQGRESSEK
jgi:hypothetical protein